MQAGSHWSSLEWAAWKGQAGAKLESIDGHLASVDTRLILLETAINGNGRDGLKSRLSNIEGKVKWLWAMILGVMAPVIALVIKTLIASHASGG